MKKTLPLVLCLSLLPVACSDKGETTIQKSFNSIEIEENNDQVIQNNNNSFSYSALNIQINDQSKTYASIADLKKEFSLKDQNKGYIENIKNTLANSYDQETDFEDKVNHFLQELAKPSFNRTSQSLNDIFTKGIYNSFTFTTTFLLRERIKLKKLEKFNKLNYVAVYTPGKVSPGIVIEKKKSNFILKLVKLTEDSDITFDEINSKDLVKAPIRIVMASDFLLLSAYDEKIKNLHEVEIEALKQAANRFTIPLNKTEENVEINNQSLKMPVDVRFKRNLFLSFGKTKTDIKIRQSLSEESEYLLKLIDDINHLKARLNQVNEDERMSIKSDIHEMYFQLNDDQNIIQVKNIIDFLKNFEKNSEYPLTIYEKDMIKSSIELIEKALVDAIKHVDDNFPNEEQAEKDNQEDIDDRVSLCTRDLNPWGNSSNCKCSDKSLNYNPETGLCQKDKYKKSNRPNTTHCTKEMNPWNRPNQCGCIVPSFSYNPRTGLCE